MLNRECTRKLCIAMSCLLLIVKVDSQNEPNYNQNNIFFADDPRSNLQPIIPFTGQPIQPAPFNQRPIVSELRSTTARFRPTANQLSSDIGPINQQNGPLSIRGKQRMQLAGAPTALTNFSINLMKIINQRSPDNLVVSPHSIATLLSLLQQGASGAALEQLSAALQMDQETSRAAYETQKSDIQKRNSNNILRSANNIFLADGFSLNPNFRAVAHRNFDSDVTPTSFINAGLTAELINRWVASKTDNKIDKLISPDSLSVNTQMVLVNAMYFKGLWDVPFRRAMTKPGDFFLSNGSKKTAQFMQSRRHYRTGVDDYTGSKVIMLPFEREEYYIMVILPHSLSIVADTLSSLTVARLEDYLNFNLIEARLELPKFSIKSDTDLTTVLTQMGVVKIFENDSSLSAIGRFQGLPPQISTAVHSAALTIDEEGGTAAAATSFAAVALSNDEPSMIFRANRPFLAILWDVKSRLPLFVATIEDPTI